MKSKFFVAVASSLLLVACGGSSSGSKDDRNSGSTSGYALMLVDVPLDIKGEHEERQELFTTALDGSGKIARLSTHLGVLEDDVIDFQISRDQQRVVFYMSVDNDIGDFETRPRRPDSLYISLMDASTPSILVSKDLDVVGQFDGDYYYEAIANNTWAPNSERLFFHAREFIEDRPALKSSDDPRPIALYAVKADGSGLQAVAADQPDVSRVVNGLYTQAWSYDSRYLAFIAEETDERQALYIADFSTTPASVTRLDQPDMASVTALEWSPTSDRLAYVASTPVDEASSTYAIYVVNADGSNDRRIHSTSSQNTYRRWFKDGEKLVLLAGYDDAGEVRNGVYVVNANDPEDSLRINQAGTDVDYFSLSSAGDYVMYTESNSGSDYSRRLYAVKIDGSHHKSLTDHAVSWGAYGALMLSYFTAGDDESSDRSLYINEMDSDQPSRELYKEGPDETVLNVDVSTDGRQTIFLVGHNYEEGAEEIYSYHLKSINSDGSNLQNLYSVSDADDSKRPALGMAYFEYMWGVEKILFALNAERYYETQDLASDYTGLYLMNPDGSNPTKVSGRLPEGSVIVGVRYY